MHVFGSPPCGTFEREEGFEHLRAFVAEDARRNLKAVVERGNLVDIERAAEKTHFGVSYGVYYA